MSPEVSALRATFQTELALMSVLLSDEQVEQLLTYIDELIRWNKVYNLTSVRKTEDMLYKHILDSLSVLSVLGDAARILDVGSGAGLPGIPLAIARAALNFTVLDSNSKKTRFMINAVGKLSLSNIDVVHSRVEMFQPTQQYDLIISRAYASLDDFVSGTRHLCKADGRWLAMKGRYAASEGEVLNEEFVRIPRQLVVPTQLGERHVVEIQSANKSSIREV